jgi:ABC-type protease/lipase transport system fused ATPase/permease subunit
MTNTANNAKNIITSTTSDVLENDIRISMPRILEILLLDRTASMPNTFRNIIWANSNYAEYDATVYAVSGNWGAGKSSMVKMIGESLKTKDVAKEDKEKGYVFLEKPTLHHKNDAINVLGGIRFGTTLINTHSMEGQRLRRLGM